LLIFDPPGAGLFGSTPTENGNLGLRNNLPVV
jgi:hypothetical protein